MLDAVEAPAGVAAAVANLRQRVKGNLGGWIEHLNPLRW